MEIIMNDLAKYVCGEKTCNSCSVCLDFCPVKAINLERKSEYSNAVIDKKKCIDCKLCKRICPRNNLNFKFKKPEKWFQGWSKNDIIRSNSASGGAASEIMHSFIKSGGKVVTCCFMNGKFVYRVIEKQENLENAAGSKYVKSDPSGIYKTIISQLKNNRILFIGLPCHVAALYNVVKPELLDNLYTIDLICHGTPSPDLLKRYLYEHGYDLNKLKTISFRENNNYCLSVDGFLIESNMITDNYIFSFLNRITFTENCYNCSFAQIKRISDITLGDSWGSDLDDTQKAKGISLILCQTSKGEELLSMSNMELLYVDLKRAIENNKQLKSPALKPQNREKFFRLFNKGIKYDRIVFRIEPVMCIKRFIKKIMSVLPCPPALNLRKIPVIKAAKRNKNNQ